MERERSRNFRLYFLKSEQRHVLYYSTFISLSYQENKKFVTVQTEGLQINKNQGQTFIPGGFEAIAQTTRA
ncbi:MAG: hypothetical protein CM15mV73_290 [Caudoviricetes sp.]|nr:MAG: hypothetical protein CM15mV73_290 [Caudoviricetes sp.]